MFVFTILLTLSRGAKIFPFTAVIPYPEAHTGFPSHYDPHARGAQTLLFAVVGTYRYKNVSIRSCGHTNQG